MPQRLVAGQEAQEGEEERVLHQVEEVDPGKGAPQLLVPNTHYTNINIVTILVLEQLYVFNRL